VFTAVSTIFLFFVNILSFEFVKILKMDEKKIVLVEELLPLFLLSDLSKIVCDYYELGTSYFELGWNLIYNADETLRNSDLAFQMFRFASIHKHPKAMHMLGRMLYLGWSCCKDEQEAYLYFAQANKLGYKGSCYYLVEIDHKNGKTLNYSYRQAAHEWYTNVMNQNPNDPDALYHIAKIRNYGEYCHEKKRGDNELSQAAIQGDAEAMWEIYTTPLLQRYDAICKLNLTPHMIQYALRLRDGDIGFPIKDVKKSFEILNACALKYQIPKAWCELAFAYQNGLGIAKDDKKAFECITKACALKWPKAQYQMAMHLLQSDEKEQEKKENEKKAFLLLEEASHNDCTTAYSALANCFAKGIGTKQDLKYAVKWYESAVWLHQATPNDLYVLSQIYCTETNGFYTVQETKFNYLLKAASLCHVEAMFELGEYFFNQKGKQEQQKRNIPKAINWWQKAAAKKHQKSIQALVSLHTTQAQKYSSLLSCSSFSSSSSSSSSSSIGVISQVQL
jgi:TPR repeat protein